MADYKVGDRVRATVLSCFHGELGRVEAIYSNSILIRWDMSGSCPYPEIEFDYFEPVVPHPQSAAARDLVVGLSSDAATRKAAPIASGVLDYFPNALAAVAHLSKVGNDQHNPGEPMHWAFNKSTDHADCILRHLAQRGIEDTDGIGHSVKVAWRALALLETELLKANPDLKPGLAVKDFKR